ncbi:hypothetical protein B0H16DRAFT_1384676 [Mycena metata]|uniref:F-box domain-containing protein n=1 Tax=Mycena metata TaxID=1033252 RepID=A0AAD7HNV8_9AGAR|nr:hypothetical protein B0H16DRAFT_1384676 [Mycena metata]
MQHPLNRASTVATTLPRQRRALASMDPNAALRAEFHHLSLSISRQKLRLDDLQTQLDSIVYPVLTLPVEITSKIFVECLPHKREKGVVNPREAPLLLMQVCRAWRNTAISTLALWSTFDVVRPNRPDLTQLALVWFERAAMRPRSVKIEGPLSNADDFIKIFRQCSREMHSLDFHTSRKDLDSMGSSRFDLESLRTLSIRVGSQPFQQHVDPLYIFQNAHRLRELASDVGPSLLHLPWAQLTKFTGELYTPAQCLEAIDSMPNLTECALAASRTWSDSPIIRHRKLRHLTLFSPPSDHRSCSATVLGYLTLPALETLKIREVGEFTGVLLDKFLRRSLPSLRQLVVCPEEIVGNNTEILLSPAFIALPLTELEIGTPFPAFISHFFDNLARTAGFLPQLRALSVRNCDGPRGPNVGRILSEAAVAITRRRNNTSGPQLQLFHVTGRQRPVSSFTETELLPFIHLKESGMDIHIDSNEDVSLGIAWQLKTSSLQSILGVKNTS